MPRVSSFFGIIIFMYPREHDPPHFHARYGEFEVVVAIDPIRTLEGYIPARQAALVSKWTTLHRDELVHNWERLRGGLGPARIPPLD
jgi:hypothetical protein